MAKGGSRKKGKVATISSLGQGQTVETDGNLENAHGSQGKEECLLIISPRHLLTSNLYPSEHLPAVCLYERCIIGIDEAGRGPVLGPLVYGLFICPESQIGWLAKSGANDSKLLTAKSRHAFFDMLLEERSKGEVGAGAVGWRAQVLHPEHISQCMLRRQKINLNVLSHATVFHLIGSLLKDGVQITKAYVDTLGSAESYRAALQARFPTVHFTVQSKADSTFPIVGAASIVAKVLRDDILAGVMGVEGASGYPGDMQTVSWMQKNIEPVFGFPKVVRFSWASCAPLLSSHCCNVRWLVQGEGWQDGGEGTIAKERITNKNSAAKRTTIPLKRKAPPSSSSSSSSSPSYCDLLQRAFAVAPTSFRPFSHDL